MGRNPKIPCIICKRNIRKDKMKDHRIAHKKGTTRGPRKPKGIWKERCPVTLCDCNAKGQARMRHIARAHPWLAGMTLR